MLNMNKEIVLRGASVIDEKEVEGYSAVIKTDDLEKINFAEWKNDVELYKEHRETCRTDRAAFEDEVYRVHDQLLQEAGEEA